MNSTEISIRGVTPLITHNGRLSDPLDDATPFAPQPDLLFILEVSPLTGRERIAARGDQANLFEDESALAASAESFARIERPYARRLNGTWSISELEHVISDIVVHAIDERLAPAPQDTPFTKADLLGAAERVERDASVHGRQAAGATRVAGHAKAR